jgi:D-amino-acid dehydrogenase
MSEPKHVLVIGAGIIGVNVGLSLQKQGFAVTLVDRDAPGRGTSFGNAGGIAATECAPISMPGTLRHVPGWLMDPTGPLSLRLSYLPQMLPWLLRFLVAGRRSNVEKIATELAALLHCAWDDYAPLIRDAKLQDAVFKDGALAVYRTPQGRRAADYSIDLRRRNGVVLTDISRDQIYEIEPDLAPIFTCGVIEENWGRVLDPFKIVTGLYQLFLDRGGKFETAEIVDFVYRDGRPHAAINQIGDNITFDKVVVCCGAWSKQLASRLGNKVPLDTERGYNTTVPYHGVTLNHMVISADDSIVLTPMEMGIRVGGAVELAGLKAAPNYDRAKALFAKGQQVLPGLRDEGGTQWMGFRPSMPDSKPVISSSSRHDNTFFAFGHGHLGLTMAATTSRLLADLVAGNPATLDMTPYRINRF